MERELEQRWKGRWVGMERELEQRLRESWNRSQIPRPVFSLQQWSGSRLLE
jgi:hypothetical protein